MSIEKRESLIENLSWVTRSRDLASWHPTVMSPRDAPNEVTRTRLDAEPLATRRCAKEYLPMEVLNTDGQIDDVGQKWRLSGNEESL